MQHYHFENLPSTQIHALSLIKKGEKKDFIVSCEKQTDGIGRRENKWEDIGTSLALSFTAQLNEIPTLTALEVALLISDFIKYEFERTIRLKWPNDLLNLNREKVGGVIINTTQDISIIGVGLNLFGARQSFDYPAGSILNKEFTLNKKLLAEKIVDFFHSERMNPDTIQNHFQSRCMHLEKEISLIDLDKTYRGIFKGIGKNGEALIDIDGKIEPFYNGSIRF
jgi:BirA family biotin operon repressor/biotin-[acetyl-CoA-carboxylase] ligase